MSDKKTPVEAAACDAAKSVATEAPSQAAIEALADRVANTVAAKTLGEVAEVKEMFLEYRRQIQENAQKAVENKPEEASAPDAANIYQAKTAAEWVKEMGFAAKSADEGTPETALGALCKGIAYGMLAKSNERGFERAMKDKALGQYEGFVGKALGVNDFTAGGALSQPQMAAEVVPALLSETAVFGDPAIQVVPVNGQMEFPYENTAPTERWTAENAAANATEPAFDQVTLRPESVSIIVPVSKKALRSVSAMAAAVERSMRNRFAERVDNKLLRGDGTTNTPVGLRYLVNSSNVLTVNATVSAANTDVDLLRLFQAIQDGNVPHTMESLRFAFAPRTWRYLMSLRGTDAYLYKPELLTGRLLGVKIAGASTRGISNIPINLSYTGSSESEIILYETSGLRLGIGEDMSITQSDVAAYNDSSGTVQASLSRNQMVFALHAEVGLVEVYRGLGIGVLPDVDWV